MTGSMIVHQIGPAASLQDLGRPGRLVQGLSRGGAADLMALHEGAALLAQAPDLAALELPGMGGQFEVTEPTRIALTGAPMAASIDDQKVLWSASHLLRPGQRLIIGGARTGVYGYLHVAGGLDTPVLIGARSAHLVAGIGGAVQAGDELPLGIDAGGPVGLVLVVEDRFSGGSLRMVESLQTDRFDPGELARFQTTEFRRGRRANRMGVALESDGPGFAAAGQLDILSDVILPGDIQMTGEGDPYVLLPECQTTGGYPRIGTVIPADLARVAQAPPGAALHCRFVPRDEAMAAHQTMARTIKGMRAACRPLVRDPAQMSDLLGYQLISGAIAATPDEGEPQ